jgi:hypothetical protein
MPIRRTPIGTALAVPGRAIPERVLSTRRSKRPTVTRGYYPVAMTHGVRAYQPLS